MNYLNHIPFFIFLYSGACKEPFHQIVMLSSISDDLKGEGWRQRFTRARVVDKYKGKGVIKVNKGGNYKMNR